MKATLEQKKYMKKYYQNNREFIIQRQKRFKEEHKNDEEWRKKRREAQNLYANRHREKLRKIAKDYRSKLKLVVLTHYGNNSPKCAYCGFSDIRALTIDHIQGGGRKDRKRIHKPFYQWLKQNNFPEGFQVLCMNCQFIKERI